jgi:hypothetical protein
MFSACAMPVLAVIRQAIAVVRQAADLMWIVIAILPIRTGPSIVPGPV